MIKYHIMSLLALAVAAFAAIEAAAQFYEAAVNKVPWYSNTRGWLMVLVTMAAVYLYFRARKFRKQAVQNSAQNRNN